MPFAAQHEPRDGEVVRDARQAVRQCFGVAEAEAFAQRREREDVGCA